MTMPVGAAEAVVVPPAVAESSFTTSARRLSDACDESTWPDVDNGLVCGECKVLVDNFDTTYSTCNGYCGSIGRSCTGAWEEDDDTCTEDYVMACSETLDSSDAICECGALASPPYMPGLAPLPPPSSPPNDGSGDGSSDGSGDCDCDGSGDGS